MNLLLTILDRLQIAIEMRLNSDVFQIIDELEDLFKTAFAPEETKIERSDEYDILNIIIEMAVVNPELSQIQLILKLEQHNPYFGRFALALDLLKLRMKEKGTFSFLRNEGKALHFMLESFRYDVKPHRMPDDLSFLSRPDASVVVQNQQTVLGKKPKEGSFLFPEKYIWMMFSEYWKEDLEHIPYFTPSQKKLMKVKRHEDGRLNRPMDCDGELPDGSYLYIISPKGGLYICQNVESSVLNDNGVFTSGLHHSSFRAGQPVLCAGFIEVERGEFTQINTSSGHYAVPYLNLLMSCLHLNRIGVLKSRCSIVNKCTEEEISVFDLLDEDKYATLRREYNELSDEISEVMPQGLPSRR